MGAFVAFLLISYFLFSRRTLKSIADLQEGVRIIGSGNLEYTLEERGGDEISELARSFNLMTANLKEVTASKADLGREIASRKLAEENLARANKRLSRSERDLLQRNADLYALNEELTATQEELQQNFDELTRAEAKVQRLAQQRQIALDAARLGWWHCDPITKVASWDERSREIFGVTGYQSPNDENPATRTHPEDREGVRAKVEAALDPVDPQTYSAEYRINLPDGSMRRIEAHGIASFEGVGENRQAISFVGTVADITERKQAEEERQQLLIQLENRTHELEEIAEKFQIANEELETMNEEMEVANEELQTFTDDLARLNRELEEAHREANLYLDIMSHDVRNANNVSSMYADLLVDLAEGDLKTYVGKLHDSIDRSTEILKNVDTIRKVQSESARLVPIDLDAVIREEIGNFPGASIRYEGRWSYVLADGLLPGIFTNLIGNAVKFGGIEVEIAVHVEERDGEVLVSVEDTGPGVPDEVKDKLFTRFERGMAKGKGEGLGLFIVRTLVTRYGGRVWIEDRVPGHPEEGAAFRFTLREPDRT
nr:ATP-binding protein [Methanoculleus sp.]